MIYYLSLGANQGDRRVNLERAVSALKSLGRISALSAIYETAAQGMAPGTTDFFNQALELESALEPEALLARCQAIEAGLGRDLRRSHLQPRPIDIDILLAGARIVASPLLTIPHPRLTERAFVLVPLLEIAPRLVHPQWHKPLAAFLWELPAGQRVVKVSE